jgi:endonuclease YncB( thermonuclease family)
MAWPALVIAGALGPTVVQRVVDGDTFDAVSEDGRAIRERLLNVDTRRPRTRTRPSSASAPRPRGAWRSSGRPGAP